MAAAIANQFTEADRIDSAPASSPRACVLFVLALVVNSSPATAWSAARDGGRTVPAGDGRHDHVRPRASAPAARSVDQFTRSLTLAPTAVAILLLVLILTTSSDGLGGLNRRFFTPSGRCLGEAGGVKPAIIGTIEMVAMASLIGVPIGMGTAIYLAEYGGGGSPTWSATHRPDGRRAVDRHRRLHLHGWSSRSAARSRRWKGRRAGGAHAPDRHSHGRGHAEAGARPPARGGAGAGHSALERSSIVLPTARAGIITGSCCPSRAPVARRRRCC